MNPEDKVKELEGDILELSSFLDKQVEDQTGPLRGALKLKSSATIDYLQLRLAVDQLNAMNAYLAALRSRISYEQTLQSIAKPKSNIIIP